MNRRLTGGLVAIFGVLMAYAVFVQKPKSDQVTPTSETELLWTIAAGQVTGVAVEELGTGRRVAFEMDDTGAWQVTAPTPWEADQFRASISVDNVLRLRILRRLSEGGDLDDFGLANPAYSVTVHAGDQGTFIAHIGLKTPTGNGYYAQQAGATEILVLSLPTVDTLIGLLDAPPYAEGVVLATETAASE